MEALVERARGAARSETRSHSPRRSPIARQREYWGKKIFLEKEICLKVEAILKAINEAITNFEISQDPQSRDVKLWGAAYKQMDKDVPPLLAELEESFRVAPN